MDDMQHIINPIIKVQKKEFVSAYTFGVNIELQIKPINALLSSISLRIIFNKELKINLLV